jgi:hypothetical protein
MREVIVAHPWGEGVMRRFGGPFNCSGGRPSADRPQRAGEYP